MPYVEEDGFEEGQRQVPYVLMREGILSAPARLVLFALMSHQPGSPQLARLTRLDLADQAGIGKAKLGQAEEELVAVGILRKEVTPVAGEGARRQVRYTLMRRRLAEFAGPESWRLVADPRVHSEPRETSVPVSVPVSVPEAIPDLGTEEPLVQEAQQDEQEVATATPPPPPADPPPPPKARPRDVDLEDLAIELDTTALSRKDAGPVFAWATEIRAAAKRAGSDMFRAGKVAVMLAALEGRDWATPPGKNPPLAYAAAWLASIEGLTKGEVGRRFERWGGRESMRFGGWRKFIELWPSLAEGPHGDLPDPFDGVSEADRYRLINAGHGDPATWPAGATAGALLIDLQGAP